jgi:hypothetical protein
MRPRQRTRSLWFGRVNHCGFALSALPMYLHVVQLDARRIKQAFRISCAPGRVTELIDSSARARIAGRMRSLIIISAITQDWQIMV